MAKLSQIELQILAVMTKEKRKMRVTEIVTAVKELKNESTEEIITKGLAKVEKKGFIEKCLHKLKMYYELDIGYLNDESIRYIYELNDFVIRDVVHKDEKAIQ